MQLRQLASDQRELARLWDVEGAGGLTDQARIIEEGLRSLSAQVLRLEKDALDGVSQTIAEEARALRPE
jgi:hypothetical protein